MSPKTYITEIKIVLLTTDGRVLLLSPQQAKGSDYVYSQDWYLPGSKVTKREQVSEIDAIKLFHSQTGLRPYKLDYLGKYVSVPGELVSTWYLVCDGISCQALGKPSIKNGFKSFGYFNAMNIIRYNRLGFVDSKIIKSALCQGRMHDDMSYEMAFPPGGPAPQPPMPLGRGFYYAEEKFWMPYPEQSINSIPAWPRPPVRALGPQGYEVSPMYEASEGISPKTYGLWGMINKAFPLSKCA